MLCVSRRLSISTEELSAIAQSSPNRGSEHKQSKGIKNESVTNGAPVRRRIWTQIQSTDSALHPGAEVKWRDGGKALETVFDGGGVTPQRHT